MNIKLKSLIIFCCSFLVAGVLLFPAKFILPMVDVPDKLDIRVNNGNIWKGNANIFWNNSPNTGTDFFIASWHLCLGRSFPFIAYCWELKEDDKDSSGKLVGIPGNEIILESLMTQVQIAPIIAEMSGNLNSELLKFSRLRGNADVNIRRINYDLQNQLPISWDGEIIISSSGFFNIDLPVIKIAMTQENFISRTEQNESLIKNKLPTLRISGSDETMDIVGEVQILPQGQIKVNSQITAKNELVSRTFAPIANNREGNKFFWSYQGAIGSSQELQQSQ